MTYTMENLAELKGRVKDALQAWVEDKIDTLFGRGHVVSHYMKRGLKNYMARIDGTANKMMDNFVLFAADENGKIDTDTLIDDLVQMFREMEVRESQIGMLNIRYGEGKIVIDVPHSLMYDMVFGKYGTITISAEDILELKELMK